MSSRKFVYDVDSQDTVLSNAFSRNVTIEEPEDSYNNSEILSTNTLKVWLYITYNYYNNI